MSGAHANTQCACPQATRRRAGAPGGGRLTPGNHLTGAARLAFPGAGATSRAASGSVLGPLATYEYSYEQESEWASHQKHRNRLHIGTG